MRWVCRCTSLHCPGRAPMTSTSSGWLKARRRRGRPAPSGFGDLFREDVRAYREQTLQGTGITPVFPLWGRPTAELAADMIAQGLRAVITCVDPAQTPAELAGRWYDKQLLRELPAGVNPCGERGEFHTFVVDGPGFAAGLHVAVGEIVERDGFVFADLLPT